MATRHRIRRRSKAGKALSVLRTWSNAIATPYTDLKPSSRHVAHVLALHMSPEGDSCFPSVPTIAGRTGYCVRTVYYALAELVERGWIEKESRPGRVNRYRSRVPGWWLERAASGGAVFDVVDGGGELEEGAGGSPSTSSAPSSSSMRRAHLWLENAGVHFDDVDDVRAELQRRIGDDVAAETLLVRWRHLTGRAGPAGESAAA